MVARRKVIEKWWLLGRDGTLVVVVVMGGSRNRDKQSVRRKSRGRREWDEGVHLRHYLLGVVSPSWWGLLSSSGSFNSVYYSFSWIWLGPWNTIQS